MQQKVLILDFGSQYTQLIARRVRELNVYCEIHPFNKVPDLSDDIKAVILSGSPFSANDEDAPKIDIHNIVNQKPTLGICYGAQVTASLLGGKLEKSTHREYGRAKLQVLENDNVLLKDIEQDSQVWMSHGDTILELPDAFKVIAKTESIPMAAFKSVDGTFNNPYFGLQFHPEVTHSIEGKKILAAFLYDVCGCNADWTPDSFVENSIEDLKKKLGDDKVVLGISGGVDSSVAAMLLHKAIGKNLYGIFVNNGLLRKNEYDEVLEAYKDLGLNIKGVDASQKFLTELNGVSDPEKKRKIIGRVFIEVFEEEANAIENVTWLAQGTIYPDVIESVSVHGPAVTIKSHHNVGGLPDRLNLKIVEPLRDLFKDEVRKVGKAVNLPENILNRHPFPGPGLAIRLIGEITEERINVLQEADAIYINNLKKYDLYDKVWQAGAILLPIKSVGVMGDERTYESVVALRCVNSVDGMTADWSHLPNDFLAQTSNEIINKVKGINRVVYDISSKPPATIEWE